MRQLLRLVALAGFVLLGFSIFKVITAATSTGNCFGAACPEPDLTPWVWLIPVSIVGIVMGLIGASMARSFGSRSPGGAGVPAALNVPPIQPPGPEIPGVADVSGTFTRSVGKRLMLTAVFELVLATFFAVMGFAIDEVRFGFLLTAGILGLVGLGLLLGAARSAMNARLYETGVQGEGRIVGLAQTGTTVNDQPVIDIQLEIHVPGNAPYVISKRSLVPMMMVGRLTSGLPLPVRVDPSEPDKVAIEWERAALMPGGFGGGPQIGGQGGATFGGPIMPT